MNRLKVHYAQWTRKLGVDNALFAVVACKRKKASRIAMNWSDVTCKKCRAVITHKVIKKLRVNLDQRKVEEFR